MKGDQWRKEIDATTQKFKICMVLEDFWRRDREGDSLGSPRVLGRKSEYCDVKERKLHLKRTITHNVNPEAQFGTCHVKTDEL